MRNLLQADARTRVWTIVLFGAAAITGAVALRSLPHAGASRQAARCLPGAAAVALTGKLSLVAWALAWAVALLTIVLAYVMVRLGVLTLRSGTFPPPGIRTLHPVQVLTGDAARRTAIASILFAAILLGFAVLLPLLMTALAERALAR